MSNFDSFKIKNPAHETVQKMQNSTAVTAAMKIQESTAYAKALNLQTSSIFAVAQELQRTIDLARAPMNGLTAMVEEYQNLVAPITKSLNQLHSVYTPIFEATRAFDALNMKGLVAGIKASMPAMAVVSKINLVNFAEIIDAIPKHDFLSDIAIEGFTVEEAEKLFENGEITQEDINEEFVDVITQKKFSPKAEWDKIQKSKWFLVIKILFCIVAFLVQPMTEYMGNKVRDELGITELIEEYGVYDIIDSFFEYFDKEAVTEVEAKETVDTTKTGNMSKQKREDLLGKIQEIRTFISSAPQDENTGNLLSYLSDLEKDVNGKKYGLVFEEHREEIDEVLDTHTPVLIEDENLFIDNGGQMNFLIEGDNLASLKLLEKTHRGKIDIIYIDPPYNTGKKNDDQGGGFIYDDSFVDENDLFIHSKWISFMEKRLKVAKKLLSPDGIIFISIGKEENATLRILCDEIFGEKNILGQIVRRTKTTSFRGNYFALRLDYVLCYCSGSNFPAKFMDITDKSKYTKIETEGKYKGELYKDDTAFYLSTLETRPNQRYWIECPDGELVIPPGTTFPPSNCDGEKAIPNDGDGVWRWEVEQYKNKKMYLSFKKTTRSPLLNQDGESAHWNIYTKSYYCDKKDDGNIPTELLLDFINRAGTKEVKDLNLDFSFPKPSALISYLIQITNKNKAITILDFFAGSGTTGHAVMKLNDEDGGNRKFILCTNNENNICHDVTYERIKRVIEKEGYKANLKYYKVEYIPISERMYYEYVDELLHHIRELVELENGVNFTNNAEIAIVLTEEELEEFVANIENFSKCKKLYMGHDLLPDEEQEQVISSHEIEVNIIPDYYYRDLQEG